MLSVQKWRNFLVVVFFATFGASVFAAGPKVVGPSVDERFELVGIVFRLAGNPEYQCRQLEKYDKDIREHFAEFKNHRAVRTVQMIRRTAGIGYDAAPSLAVQLDLAEGHVTLPVDMVAESLDRRWGPRKAVEKFVAALDDFYVKSKFHDLYEAHRELYRTAETRLAEITKEIDFPWYDTFYGSATEGEFHIVIFMIDEHGGYGTRREFPDGRKDAYATICVGVDEKGEPAFRRNWAIPIIVHEFNHSFCNPLVDKYMAELKPAADRLFPFVAKKMAKQAYPLSSIMLREYLVRACEIRYLQEHDDREGAERYLQTYTRSGFLWLGTLVDALGRYANERDKYPTLDDFMPEIVKLQNETVNDAFIARLAETEKNRPKVVRCNPPNGAKNVDPTITEISVTFDRKMGGGCAWCTMDDNATFPRKIPGKEQTKPTWSKDGTTCTMDDLTLEPVKTYNIWLNTGNFDFFRSEAGVPLEPVHYTFTTRGE